MSTLLLDPARGFRMWNIEEIYDGPAGLPEKKVVPNVNDGVIDWDSNIYRVISVDTDDPTPSFLSVLELWNPMQGVADDNDSLITGLSGYQPTLANRAFFDGSVAPFTLSIDSRFVIYGTDANVIKLFLGSDTSAATGIVISQKLNGSMQVIGENIDLELLDPGNTAMKRPEIIYTGNPLQDGELVTMVIYTQAGGVMGEVSFIVKNSTAIRTQGASTVSLVDIELLSTLIDPGTPDLVQAPQNVPLSTGDFQCRLHYSDGTSNDVAFDGVKVKLIGLGDYNPAIVGPEFPLVAMYYPDPGEPFINGTNPTNPHLSSIYRLQAIPNDLGFAFKVYVLPQWNSTSSEYDMKYYLTTVERDLVMEVSSPEITLTKIDGTGTPIGSFDPAPGSGLQRILLTADLDAILPGQGYGGVSHTQIFKIELSGNSALDDSFVIDYIGDGVEVLGMDTKFHASNATTKPLTMAHLHGDGSPTNGGNFGGNALLEWQSLLYESSHPLYDGSTEVGPPVPTHVKLRYYDALANEINTPDIQMLDWDLDHDHVTGADWVEASTVEVHWMYSPVGGGSDLTIAITPVMVHADYVP